MTDMSLNSFRFLLLAAVLLWMYYVIPRSGQWVLLLLTSLGFYAAAGIGNLIFLLLSILLTYGVTRIMARNQKRLDRKTAKCRNRKWMWLSVCLLFGLLAVFKIRFTFRGVLLPLGISFYLFQSAGYVLDVYRGSIQPQRNPGKLALFLCYFPQLTQGPISRYSDLMPRLLAPHARDGKAVCFGLQRMLWGYFKKLVIADRIAVAVVALKAPEYTGNAFLLLTVFYAVQIYGDFTGGMDIAIGLSEALGIALAENFAHPFFSRNIAQYWRRWHITLGEWMKNYIFYPLSVSSPMRKLSKAARKRCPKLGKRLPVYIASLVTWLCTGVWHGITANFILWGLMNCTVILVSEECAPLYEKFHSRFHWNEKPWYSGFEMLRTFVLMNLIRIVDLFPDVRAYFRRIGSLFSGGGVDFGELGLTVLDFGILALGCAAMLSVSLFQEKHGSLRETMWKHEMANCVLTFALFLAVLLMGRYGIGYDAVNFIYNQF